MNIQIWKASRVSAQANAGRDGTTAWLDLEIIDAKGQTCTVTFFFDRKSGARAQQYVAAINSVNADAAMQREPA
jgi:hypothetical protein